MADTREPAAILHCQLHSGKVDHLPSLVHAPRCTCTDAVAPAGRVLCPHVHAGLGILRRQSDTFVLALVAITEKKSRTGAPPTREAVRVASASHPPLTPSPRPPLSLCRPQRRVAAGARPRQEQTQTALQAKTTDRGANRAAR